MRKELDSSCKRKIEEVELLLTKDFCLMLSGSMEKFTSAPCWTKQILEVSSHEPIEMPNAIMSTNFWKIKR